MGTGLNNLNLFFLNSANGIVLTQSIWWTVKRHALSIGGLDNLFALSTDITGFINVEVLRKAKIAIPIAFIFWCVQYSLVHGLTD
jgi:ABC-type maltose transport system permease subunit